jgi:hypothetical protein
VPCADEIEGRVSRREAADVEDAGEPATSPLGYAYVTWLAVALALLLARNVIPLPAPLAVPPG